MSERSRDQLKSILKKFYFNEINEILIELSEKELQELLQLELEGEKRRYLVVRIYARYNKVKGKRELKEILNEIAKASNA